MDRIKVEVYKKVKALPSKIAGPRLLECA